MIGWKNFKFENATDRLIYFNLKGLHIQWQIPPKKLQLSCDSSLRFKQNPKTICTGIFPVHKFHQYFQIELEIQCKFQPTQTMIDETETKSIEPTKDLIFKSFIIQHNDKDVSLVGKFSSSFFFEPTFYLETSSNFKERSEVNESIHSIRQSIFFYQTFLMKLKAKVKICIMEQDKVEIVKKMYPFIGQFIIGREIHQIENEKLIQFFNECVELIDHDVDDMDLDGYVINGKEFKNLNNRPILYFIQGQNLYDLLKEKEKKEKQFMKLNIKPFIVFENEKSINEFDGYPICKWFRETLDFSLERITQSCNQNDYMKCLTKVIQYHEKRNPNQKKHVWFYGLKNEIESIHNSMNSLKNELIQKVICVQTREQFQVISNNMSMDTFQIHYVNELRKNVLDFLNHNLKSKIEHPKNEIEKNDVVVLCVELNGRVLITGTNGIYMNFINYVQKYTKNLILFIDRQDKHESEKDKQIFPVYGDSSDLILDEELKKTQKIDQYFKFRFYYSHHEKNNNFEEFWKKVLSS